MMYTLPFIIHISYFKTHAARRMVHTYNIEVTLRVL